MLIDADRASDDGGIAGEAPLPAGMANDGDEAVRTAATKIVPLVERPPDRGANPQRREVAAARHQDVRAGARLGAGCLHRPPIQVNTDDHPSASARQHGQAVTGSARDIQNPCSLRKWLRE